MKRRKKKKPRKDEGHKFHEKEVEEKNRRTQKNKRLRMRSRSKHTCEFSEEMEDKEIKIRRRMKAESFDLIMPLIRRICK